MAQINRPNNFREKYFNHTTNIESSNNNKEDLKENINIKLM